MDQQTDRPDIATEGFDPFASTLNATELELLHTLYRPAFIAKISPEFSHLRNLGLVFMDPQTGYAQLTPLGKSWLWSQTHPSNYG